MTTYEWLSLIVVLVGGFWVLHHDLQNFVRREDCDREMGAHCGRIDAVEKRLGKVENRVTEAETQIDIFHNRGGQCR